MRWCGAQSAVHLGKNRRKRAVVGEVVYVLGTQVSGTVHVLAGEPIIPSAYPIDRTFTR